MIKSQKVNNIWVLENIIEELMVLEDVVEDRYMKSAVQANLIKYRNELETERAKNAMAVVAHKIKHLTNKLS